MKRFLVVLALLAPGLSWAQTHEQNLSRLGVPPGTTGTFCIEWSTTSGPPSYSTCAATATFEVNGTALSSYSTINFENSAATGGLTLQFSNPSAGNVQLGLSGWPSLVSGDCLTNNGSTLSWGTCGGGSGTVNSGTSGYVAYYAATGTTVSGLSMSGLQADLVAANANVITGSPGNGPVNDWNPTGWGTTVAFLHVTPATGGSTLDGLVAGSNMQVVAIDNNEAAGGADNVILVSESSSDSTAANRFHASGNLLIPPGGRVICIDEQTTLNRWSCQ